MNPIDNNQRNFNNPVNPDDVPNNPGNRENAQVASVLGKRVRDESNAGSEPKKLKGAVSSSSSSQNERSNEAEIRAHLASQRVLGKRRSPEDSPEIHNLKLAYNHYKLRVQTRASTKIEIFKNDDVFNQFIEKVNQHSDSNETVPALRAAAKCGYFHTADFLLKNKLTTNTDLLVSIQEAIKVNDVKFLRFLFNLDCYDLVTPESNLIKDAAKLGAIDVLDYFLDCVEDVEEKGELDHAPFFTAAKYGQIPALNLMLRRGFDIDAKDQDGKTVLHLVTEMGHANTVRFLIDQGANIETRDILGTTPLHIAAANGHLVIAKLLVENDADVEAETVSKFTPLHVAAKMNHGDVLKYLIDQKAEIEVKDLRGLTPLHFAVRDGHNSIAEILLKSNANVNSVADRNFTPLHLAAALNRTDMVTILLNNRADIHAKTVEQTTPLHLAIYHGHLNATELLLRYCPNDLNAKFADGQAPLHVAAKNNRGDILKLLINQKAEIDISDINGYTALHYAARFGHPSIAEFLIKNHANVNAESNGKFTPLHFAATNNQTSIITILLNNQAKIDAKNKDGLPPLAEAIYYGSLEAMKLLLEFFPDGINTLLPNQQTLLHFATKFNNEIMVKLLIEKGAEIEAKSINNFTPLLDAAYYGYTNIVRILLDNKADIHAKEHGGRTCLHLAVKNGHVETARYLIEKGAEIEAKSDYGRTPLHSAVVANQLQSVELLTSELYLADINAVNKRDGFTPLYYAALSENKEITERLLKMGANIHKRMGQQMTALQVALRFNKLVSIELIIEYLINKHSSSSENLVNFLKSLKDGKLTAQSLAKRASQLEDLNEVLNSVEEAKTFLAFLELDENKLKAFFQNRIKETKFKDIFIDACCEINSIHWMYQINPVHFKKSFTPIELPKEEPEAKLGELTTLFDRVHKVSDQLHMENNPELRETELLNREALKKGLEEFIGKIQDSAAIIGAPRADNVEALQAFWRKNRIMAKLLIERISESLNEVERASQNQAEHARLEDTISQLMDCIVCFSEAGSYCATRINQALSRHYCIFFLSDEEKENQMSPFEKKVFDSANQLKLKAIDKVSNGDVHTLNAIHYFLGNELGIHSAAAYFDQLVMGSEEFNREFKERLRLHLSSYINVKSYAEYFYKKMNSDEYKWMELIEILTLRHYEKKPERFLDDSDEESLVPKLTPYAALEILTHLDIFVSEQ